MTGCCVDKSCTPETCMRLPEGKACGDCFHFLRCQQFAWAESLNTTCDFFPRRFVETQPARSGSPEGAGEGQGKL